MKGKNLKILLKKYIIQEKVFFQILLLKNYHFVNITGKNTDQLLVRPIRNL
jgi:hypothetical protein